MHNGYETNRIKEKFETLQSWEEYKEAPSHSFNLFMPGLIYTNMFNSDYRIRFTIFYTMVLLAWFTTLLFSQPHLQEFIVSLQRSMESSLIRNTEILICICHVRNIQIRLFSCFVSVVTTDYYRTCRYITIILLNTHSRRAHFCSLYSTYWFTFLKIAYILYV